MQLKPKFKIGDVVYMLDYHNYNPSHKAISIGKIQSIHILKYAYLYPDKNDKGVILYSISGFSIKPSEDKLKLWEDE